jgi:hypothetical protein
MLDAYLMRTPTYLTLPKHARLTAGYLNAYSIPREIDSTYPIIRAEDTPQEFDS